MTIRIKSMSTVPPLRNHVARTNCQKDRLWTAVDMVKSYLKAKASGRGAPDSVVEERLQSCRGCASYCTHAGKSWCGACGCGSNRKEAIIEGGEGPSKLTFLRLDCPRRRPGFSNAEDNDGQ
jgi:hypothetical protein